MNVVFAASFLVPQRLAGMEYFRRVAPAFSGALFPPAPTVRDVSIRGQQLADWINIAFPAGRIHIVAHGMAGLDARFLLSNNLLGLADQGRVASLSTVSTPHWGTPIADFLTGPKPDILDHRRITWERLLHVTAQLGQPAGELEDLTFSSVARFNLQNANAPGVRYLCYAASGIESSLLQLPHWYIDLVGKTPDEKANDGLVTVKSASWTPLAEEPWPTDHLGEVGYNLSSPTLASTFDHISAYRRILARAEA